MIARQVRAGLQTDPEDPQERKEQTCHHCQQYSSPQVDFYVLSEKVKHMSSIEC